MSNGKTPLDHRTEGRAPAQVAPYLDVARRHGDKPSQKEMALTRRPRDEDDNARAKRFVDIERDDT
jgi:hypothetical protein